MSLNGRLGWALLISLGLHAVLLGLGMHSLPVLRVPVSPSPLELELVTNDSHDTDHGGSGAENLPVFPGHPVTESGQALNQRPQTVPAPQPSPEAAPVTGNLDLTERSLQWAREDAMGGVSDQHIVTLTSGTRDSVFAPYEEAFSKKVEEVGSLNYPSPINGQALHGSVRVTTTIKPDGSVAYVEVVHSSGSPELDEAARHIIRMASPYQPFTKAMAERADLVSITRTFNFVQAGDVTGGKPVQ